MSSIDNEHTEDCAEPGAEDYAPPTASLELTIGTRIRAARRGRGMTLAQLGGNELSRSFLSLVERGKSRISLRALQIVARRLELPISHFVEDTAGTAGRELTQPRALPPISCVQARLVRHAAGRVTVELELRADGL